MNEKDKLECAYLLCNAFEGGSNYWYTINRFVVPKAEPWKFPGDKEVFRHIGYPLTTGGAVIVADKEDEGKEYRLDLKAIQRGWKLLKETQPRHYADVLKENADATTGDVFLQCCLFGEVVYG